MNINLALISLAAGLGLAAGSFPAQEQQHKAEATVILTFTDIQSGRHMQMICAPAPKPQPATKKPKEYVDATVQSRR